MFRPDLIKPGFIETADDFYRTVRIGETQESLTLEFKKDLNGYLARGKDARNHQKELCRDLSQFANSYGGCLLIGVKEGHDGTKRVATGIHSIDDFDGRRQWIEQSRQNFLIPATMCLQIHSISLAEGQIIAINVVAHQHLVWIWDRDGNTMECVRRTTHGKENLNPDEVEAHLMDSSRSCKLAFLRVVTAATGESIDLVSGVWMVSSGGAVGSASLLQMQAEVNLIGSGEHEFELGISSSFLNGTVPVRLPYGLIKEVWVTSGGKIGLMLEVRLVTGQSRNSLTMLSI